MKKVVLVVLVSLGIIGPVGAVENSVEAVRSMLHEPPVEYRSSPLVVWNDDMTEEKIANMLTDLQSQGVWQLFIHPRPSLVTPYLSERWLDLYEWTIGEADRLGMRVWIYDENSYPSGFAGGHVPHNMPESRGIGVHLQRAEKPPEEITDEIVAVHRVVDGKTEDVTDAVREGNSLPDGEYQVFTIRQASMGNPWYAGYCYVDLLRPGVTEEFLEVTLETYRKRFGDQFGKLVPGSFTDEPHLRPAGGIHWSKDFLDRFEARWGYSLRGHLPSLFEEVGDWKRVRHNWHRFLLEEFIEHWAKPYYEYCAKNDLDFTGHYWEHGWPNCNGVTDNMAMAAFQQIPGIDCLMNRYSEGPHAQFGNVRAVKEVASIANQLGRERVLCEAYGAAGWDFEFQDMKRIADWLCVLGVNFIDQHLSYTTIRGARKRDHPPSFTYHEPWWPLYHVSGDYLARMMLAVSSGRQENRVLVIEPTSTAWMYLSVSANHPRLNEIGETFQRFVTELEDEQLEFDLGCEDVIARWGAASRDKFIVGERTYDLVVLPPGLENLNRATATFLKHYVGSGGQVLSLVDAPVCVDGSESNAFAREIAGEVSNWKRVSTSEAMREIRLQVPPTVTIAKEDGAEGKLFHNLRVLDDGYLLFLVNTSLDGPAKGSCRLRGQSVELWDLSEGSMTMYPYYEYEGRVTFDYDLPPAGSALFCVSPEKPDRFPPPDHEEIVIDELEPVGPLAVNRDRPNVLTLDFCDISVGGEQRESTYFHKAQQLVFQKHGFQQNLWERSVQFKDNIISREEFGPDTGFEANFHFFLRGFGDDNPDMSIVVEQPDLYTISVNGEPVEWDGERWWLDRCFGVLDIEDAVTNGENILTLKASPFSIFHELESVYLLGDFALEPVERGFVVVPARDLDLGPWKGQGMPLYGDCVSYTQTFDVSGDSDSVYVCLGDWDGSVAEVTVNGESAGVIACQPWELDISDSVEPGRSTVTVRVYGTLKNTLGPHHGNPQLGTAWPGQFQVGPESGPPPGESYHVVGYGLFEPFQLEVRR